MITHSVTAYTSGKDHGEETYCLRKPKQFYCSFTESNMLQPCNSRQLGTLTHVCCTHQGQITLTLGCGSLLRAQRRHVSQTSAPRHTYTDQCYTFQVHLAHSYLTPSLVLHIPPKTVPTSYYHIRTEKQCIVCLSATIV